MGRMCDNLSMKCEELQIQSTLSKATTFLGNAQHWSDESFKIMHEDKNELLDLSPFLEEENKQPTFSNSVRSLGKHSVDDLKA